jgi:hypothetical protein
VLVCSHAQLQGTWSQLASAVSTPSSSSSGADAAAARPVHIGEVDATVELFQSKRFDIRGFPSLKLFARGKMYDYKGPRTLEALEKFARSGGEGAEGHNIPEPPNQMSVAAREAACSAVLDSSLTHRSSLCARVTPCLAVRC